MYPEFACCPRRHGWTGVVEIDLEVRVGELMASIERQTGELASDATRTGVGSFALTGQLSVPVRPSIG